MREKYPFEDTEWKQERVRLQSDRNVTKASKTWFRRLSFRTIEVWVNLVSFYV